LVGAAFFDANILTEFLKNNQKRVELPELRESNGASVSVQTDK